ncbi:MAG: FtsX-like permease family protein [Alphaproteobacteria bacterium]
MSAGSETAVGVAAAGRGAARGGVGLAMAVKIARREMRGGIRGFRVFLGCLALGVAAIAAVGSLSAGIEDGLRADARALLGGDVEVRQLYTPIEPEQRAFLDAAGATAASRQMRAMARTDDGAARALIELKAVDGRYPLFGAVETAPAAPLDDLFAADGEGRPGAVVDGAILRRLGLAVGDPLRIGDGSFHVAAELTAEPDRLSSTGFFSLGPKVIIADAALAATGLVQEGSLIYHFYRVALPEGADAAAFKQAVTDAFPDAPIRVRDFSDGAEGLRQFVDRLSAFLTLVGLTALLVGGVGVANAVRAYLDAKVATIATLKCLGASNRLVFGAYLIQVMALAGLGTVAGLVVGALAPALATGFLNEQFGLTGGFAIHPLPLVMAAAFGLLTALAFSIWPLARAREVPPAQLFRAIVAPARRWPGRAYMAMTFAAGGALAVLAVLTAADKLLAALFVGGALGTMLAFRGAAALVAWTARRAGRPHGAALRLGLANIHRPGSATASVVLSLGLGLTVLVAIALIEGNLRGAIQDRIPEQAPAYFFLDIQPDQVATFEATAAAVPGVGTIQGTPMLRGRIVAINGVPAEQVQVAPEAQWGLRSERGLTYAAEPPENNEIVAGEWWPADYAGPPLISFSADLANGFGIGVGDSLTYNVLGREMTATVANLREIEWGTLQLNFTTIFSPGVLDAAPHTLLATVQATPDAELPLERAVTDALPNVSAIRVRDALDTANQVLTNIALAVTATAAITLVAGALVLAGAVAAGHRRRVYDAVVLKVLGATRGQVSRAFLVEYGLLGIATAVVAAALGAAASFVVVTQIMNLDWAFLPSAVLLVLAVSLAVTLAFGFLGAWRALGQKAAPLLRNA